MKFLVLLALILISSFPSKAQDNVDRPLVTVSGQAEIMITPDEVAFNLRVTSEDKDLLIAQQRNDEIVKKVIALAVSYQIPPSSIQTGYISLDRRFSSEEATRKPSVFIGYIVTKRIAIILHDVSKAEQLLSELFKTGLSGIDSVNFRSTELRKYRDQARAKAIKAAQEKASALAREIGQSIGKAYTITEEGLGGYNLNYSANANYSESVSANSSENFTTLALGQISVTAKVVVAFELK
jgi:uncharacterized protein YggE